MAASPRVLLAEYFTSDDLTLLFLLRADFDEPVVVGVELPGDDVRKLTTESFGLGGEGSVLSLDLERWHGRFGPLVAPIAEWSDEGDIIWLVPHGMLHYLPLHALRIDEERHLIERNPVCYTPSASVMRYCHDKRKGRRQQALVLGDSRSDLLHARDEALTVASMFGARAYFEGAATKTVVRERLRQEADELDVLHFSCHGYFDQEQALKSGIVLAPEPEATKEEDGTLTAEEIFGMSLHADLVTLSACQSGVNERRPGDELIGLTRALIYAGTPSVVVSLWMVDDLSTGLLMQRFYERLRGPEAGGSQVMKAHALQAAQLDVMHLKAEEVVRYCEARLAALDDRADEEWRLCLELDRANATAAAGELAAAMAAYRDIGARLQAFNSKRAEQLAKAVSEGLELLEFKAEADPAVDWTATPFGHLYHWAPFILVGDWR
jgi:CHAT domain-containing protein